MKPDRIRFPTEGYRHGRLPGTDSRRKWRISAPHNTAEAEAMCDERNKHGGRKACKDTARLGRIDVANELSLKSGKISSLTRGRKKSHQCALGTAGLSWKVNHESYE